MSTFWNYSLILKENIKIETYVPIIVYQTALMLVTSPIQIQKITLVLNTSFYTVMLYNNVLVGFPGLSNIDGKTVSADYESLEVSFLKWNQQMIGDTPPDQYVYLYIFLDIRMLFVFC